MSKINAMAQSVCVTFRRVHPLILHIYLFSYVESNRARLFPTCHQVRESAGRTSQENR